MRAAVTALAVFAGLGVAAPLPSAHARGLIAFQDLSRDGILVVKPDGSKRRMLVRGAEDAAWSPSGRRIAYVRDVRKPSGGPLESEIFIARADGSRERRLAHLAGDESDPAFSPDGRELVFTRVEGAHAAEADLYAIGRDGRGLRRLTNLPGFQGHPSWSVNDEIAFHGQGPEPYSFRIYRVDVQAATSPVELGSGSQPAWAPDGETIAFVQQLSQQTSDGLVTLGSPIFTIDRLGGARTQRTLASSDTPYDYSDPAFSPSGNKIVAGEHLGSFKYDDLERLDLATGRLTQLATAYCCELDPAWQPTRRLGAAH